MHTLANHQMISLILQRLLLGTHHTWWNCECIIIALTLATNSTVLPLTHCWRQTIWNVIFRWPHSTFQLPGPTICNSMCNDLGNAVMYHNISAFMLLVGQHEGHPACKKNWVVGCWHGCLSGWCADLHMAQMMPLPLTVSCSSKIQIGSGTGSPG